MSIRVNLPISCLAICASLILCACSHSTRPSGQAKRGYFPLQSVKVGMPEESIKKSIFTFAPDPSGRIGDQVQYLSRGDDAYGGQFVIHCRASQVYQVQVYHLTKPVSKDIALLTLKTLLPAEAFPDNRALGPGKFNSESASESWNFGANFSGELVYTGNNQSEVKIINALHAPTASP